MNAAQVSFVSLSVVFLVCGTVLFALGHWPAGTVLLSVAGIGWTLLAGMISNDRKAS